MSSSVLPSTSKSALRSTLEENVAIPVTLNVSLMLVMSNSVIPSTSKFPLASISLAKVAIPVTVSPTPSAN